MSSKMVSSTVQAVYYDDNEDMTFIFTMSPKGVLHGFQFEGELAVLDNPEDILEKISSEESERLVQLKSVEATINARAKKEGPGEAAGSTTGSGQDQAQ